VIKPTRCARLQHQHAVSDFRAVPVAEVVHKVGIGASQMLLQINDDGAEQVLVAYARLGITWFG
jgi:hypothetical protein